MVRKKRDTIITALAGLALCAMPVITGAQVEARAPKPDPTLQAEIRQAVHASSAEELRGSLEALRLASGPDDRVLTVQLFLYSKAGQSTRDAMAFGFLAGELRLSEQAIVRALVPLLEVPNEDLRRDVAGFLAEYEDASADRRPSFEVYRTLLDEKKRNGEELPQGLIGHLYRVDAGAALVILARNQIADAQERKPLLWAEHVVSDTLWKQRNGFLDRDRVEPEAAEQLALLSTHTRWWARLYAAQVMSRHAAFRDAETLSRLAGDENALVRETVRGL